MKKLFVCLFTILMNLPLLANDISWAFPPTTLSSSGVNATDPHIVMDPSGNRVAVWVENNVVKANTALLNGSWGTAVTLSGTSASTPHVVVDQNGNATAVWNDNSTIKASSKPFGGNWSNATALSSSGASSPSLAVDSGGDVVAAWARSGNIESSTKLFGANWQNHVTITSSQAAMPKVAVGGTGSNTRAVIVWQGVSGTTNVIFSATKTISGNWSSQLVISDTAHFAATPKVAADSNGIATAVWFRYDVSGSIYSNLVVQTSTRLTSGTWTPVTSLSATGAYNPANLSANVVVDAFGNTMAMWSTSYDGETFNIESAYRPLRGNWTPSTILVMSNIYAYSAEMTVSSLGDALAGFMFYNGAIVMQAAEADMSGFLPNTWSVPRNLSSGVDNAFPRVAAALVSGTLNSAAIWTGFDGTHTTVQTATGSRSVVSPPTSLGVTQQTNNLGVFTEYQNTISWTASTGPNVAGYLVYRNGVLVNQVDASTTQVVDHNMVQNGSVTYSVAAFDNQNSRSQAVSVSFP